MNTEKILIYKDEVRDLYLLISQVEDINSQMQCQLNTLKISDFLVINNLYIEELKNYIIFLAAKYDVENLPKV